MLNALRKTRFNLKRNLAALFNGDDVVGKEDFLQIKSALIEADVGTKNAEAIVGSIESACHKKGIIRKSGLKITFEEILIDWLGDDNNWQANSLHEHETILVFGINGAGKTTTIAKIAAMQTNTKTALAAGDTYRAAAIQQLEEWGNKIAIPVFKSSQGSDCASLVFESIEQTKKEQYQLLIADTSGRLHNNNDLMQELKKVIRVSKKADPNAPQHRWLVLDATIGLNSISQAKSFHEHLDITGIIITKLDSSAKAGAIFAIKKEIPAPILFITTGENINDIARFNGQEFVKAFLDS